ncbi:hypothetical protein AFB00_04965 [Pseudonocardia sp. HH130630-07]|nr:hypothetical protein AFB00_04965 [Pseudonocardia sp. HH130630-07]
MPTVSAPAEQPADAEHLRAALVEHIRGRGGFTTDTVERAFSRVPRHVFLPGVDLTEAYAPRPVITKRGANGAALSSASSPNLVAEMLELLAVTPGNRILEIGAATGFNAALLAELTGKHGHVSTVEIDQDLTEGARHALDTAGYPEVQVHCGDGALGHPDTAPYDRIIVTAGAWDISQAWWDQLAPGGRLVVPVRLHGSGLTRVLPLDHDPDATSSTDDGAPVLVARSALVCGFVPMRGTDEHPEDVVRLDTDVVMAVERSDRPDPHALGQALSHDPLTRWTGVTVGHDEPAEHLDLWLATTADPSTTLFGRLRVGPDARRAGIVTPALRWAGATLYRDGSFAYLTTRQHDDTADELGITAHGPDATAVADELGHLLGRWACERPAQPTITAHREHTPRPSRPEPDDSGPGIVRETTHFTITW